MAWAAVILVMTSWPSPALPAAPAGSDKLAHFTGYAVLGWLVARALVARARLRGAAEPRILVPLLALAAFAAADELHQFLVPGRFAGLGDWAADLTGALTGLAAGLHFFSLARRRQDLPT